MTNPPEPSHPPSDPHAGMTRLAQGAGFGGDERPDRAQLIAALLLGLVLVASGLYVWRRPRHPTDSTSTEATLASAAASGAADAGALLPVAEAGSPLPVTLSEARVLGCHDRGPRKTPAEQCDRLAPLEQALARAIEQAEACFPSVAPGATIEYVADVSFSRRKLRLSLPRAGRSLSDRKVVNACATAVRGGMQSIALEGVEHQHARYQISVTATYRGKT
jgi:hypothetical protein